ncbi:hypothetical protein ACFP81_08570 [Deinococcus lacus]|uniref:Uncharacterized protein n=1 Tax=Deinococcus lacus TaxID=392561 RepID=A0ABW1YEN2_9DEIO
MQSWAATLGRQAWVLTLVGLLGGWSAAQGPDTGAAQLPVTVAGRPEAAPPIESAPRWPRWPAKPSAAAPEGAAEEDTESSAVTGEDDYSSLELVRTADDGTERRIRVVRRGTEDDTGIFAVCQPQEDDPAGTPNLAVFSESGEGESKSRLTRT